MFSEVQKDIAYINDHLVELKYIDLLYWSMTRHFSEDPSISPSNEQNLNTHTYTKVYNHIKYTYMILLAHVILMWERRVTFLGSGIEQRLRWVSISW